MNDARIELCPYDPAWPALFVAEQTLLASVLAPWLAGSMAHIGSTAVPGLAAKPVIDIMAPVVSLAASRDGIAAAGLAGYVHFPYQPDVMHWFCKPSPAHRTHHLHLVPADSRLWFDRLAFRDALRRSPALAQAYAALKARLADAFADDREAYTQGKTAFVRQVLSGAAGGG